MRTASRAAIARRRLAVAGGRRGVARSRRPRRAAAPAQAPRGPAALDRSRRRRRLIGGSGSGNPTAFAAGDKMLAQARRSTTEQRSPGRARARHGRLRGRSPDRDEARRQHRPRRHAPLRQRVQPRRAAVQADERVRRGRRRLHARRRDARRSPSVPVGGTTDRRRATGSGATCCPAHSPASTCRCRASRPTCASCRTRSSRRSRSSSRRTAPTTSTCAATSASASGSTASCSCADADAGYFAPSLPTAARYTPRMIATMTPPELRPIAARRACRDAAKHHARQARHRRRHGARRRVQPARRVLPRVRGQATAEPDRRHLPRPLRQPGRRLPPPRVRVHGHRERARHPDALRRRTRRTRSSRCGSPSAAGSASISAAPRSAWRSPAPTTRRCTARAPTIRSRSRPSTRSNYTQLEGDIRGLTAAAARRQEASRSTRRRRAARSTATAAAAAAAAAGPDRDHARSGPARGDAGSEEADAGARASRLADTSAYRGDVIHVEGRVARRRQGARRSPGRRLPRRRAGRAARSASPARPRGHRRRRHVPPGLHRPARRSTSRPTRSGSRAPRTRTTTPRSATEERVARAVGRTRARARCGENACTRAGAAGRPPSLVR